MLLRMGLDFPPIGLGLQIGDLLAETNELTLTSLRTSKVLHSDLLLHSDETPSNNVEISF
jgi:hypothetical protein